MIKKNLLSRRGFSLIESLVAVMVFSVIAVMITQIVAYSIRAVTKNREIVTVRASMVSTLGQMERLLRVARLPVCSDLGGVNTLTYQDQDGYEAVFRFTNDHQLASGSSELNREVYLLQDIVLNTVFFNCNTDPATNASSISIIMQGGTQSDPTMVELQTKIFPRNYLEE